MNDDTLDLLAGEAGLSRHWRDADNRPQVVSDDNLRRLLGALGLPAGRDADIAESRERLRRRAIHAPLVTGDVGAPVIVPPGFAERSCRLILADGETRDVTAHTTELGVAVPPIDRPGYHRLESDDAEVTLAIAPAHVLTPADIAAGKLWGVGLQIYSLRDPASPGFGDFGALARFASAAGAAGASLLAVSPTHAPFTADAARFSPYGPSTRLFLNALYADPRVMFPDAPGVEALGEPDLIDWPRAWPARVERLRRVFAGFQGDRESVRRADFEAFRREGGADLQGHAVFEALHGHFFRQTGAWGWPAWPEAYHDARAPAVAAFARREAAEVEFHAFLQWLADRSLAAAQAAARAAGMPIGLVADLAVGMDPGGSHAWSRPQDLLGGVNVGAPPDPLGPDGQDWGLAAFSPSALKASGYHAFRATLRAALRHAGGLRIDHAMGLGRLWLVPRGGGASDGAYLAYPFDDMIRLLTLEAWLNRAVVVAEDLGTVPDGFRETLKERRIMGMQVLWFERTHGGGFTAPDRWSDTSAALSSTHDLPTIAGWWRGRDIDWSFRLGRKSGHATEADARWSRGEERGRLWRACQEAGVADGDEPAADDPEPAVDATIAFVAASECPVAIFPAEDLAALVEQPNLPGTMDEHPNWRRRLPPTDELLNAPAVRRRMARLSAVRPGTRDGA